MTPVTQTKLSDPENNIRGNCFAACLATLLDLPLESVPAFETMAADGAAFQALCSFLDSGGYVYQGTYTVSSDVPDWWAKLYQTSCGLDGYFIVNGPSPRAEVTGGHSTVWKDGLLMHDPHPSRSGLTYPVEVVMIERIP